MSAQRDDLEERLSAAEDEMEASALLQQDTARAADETANDAEERVAAVEMKWTALQTRAAGYDATYRVMR